ncbi:MAG: phage tail protein [Cetobacterium sp.]
MSYFNNLTLTTKGQEMLLSSNMNINKIITFTNASLGSEKLLPEEIKGATEIKNSWLKFPLNTVRIINDESNYFLRTEIAFTNAGIIESKIMRELGIYAKFENEEEVLFAYSTTNDDGETIPKEDIVPATYKFTIDTTISTETKINQTLNPEGFLTKEVIELLKESIRNIAFRKIRGTLVEGQSVIQVSTGAEMIAISERASLNIEGEIYFLDRDYTIDVNKNTITLLNPFKFKTGDMYEIIDPLPPTYVKEQIEEFVEEFKKLVSDSKVEFDSLKEEIYLEFDKKIEEVYKEFDEYIEENKENLKGYSVDRIVEDGQDENGGNKYKLIRDDEKEIGEIVSPKGNDGERGIGVVDWESGDNTADGNPTARLILEDGSRTPTSIPIPAGPKGDNFRTAKTYSSIVEMEEDFLSEDVYFGEYVVISSKDDDNAKLFLKEMEGFKFVVQMALPGAGTIDKEFVREDEKGNYVYRDIYSDGRKSSEYISPRGPRGFTGGTGEGELPPSDYLYGEIRSFTGDAPPSGWLYTNGGVIEKKKYPHMSFLPGITLPQEPYFKLDSATRLTSKGDVNGQGSWEFDFKNSKGKIYQDFSSSSKYEMSIDFNSLLRNKGFGTGLSLVISYGMTNRYYYIELAESVSLSFVSMDRINASGSSNPIRNGASSLKQNVDVYFDIEYLDENNNWIKGAELHNKTDFIPVTEESEKAVAMIKSSFKSKNFRLVTNNKSEANINSNGYDIFFVGEVTFGFDKGGNQYSDYLQLPNEKDDQGRYKVIYVGQPLEIEESTMALYNEEYAYIGETPFSSASENKLPSYSEGITMAELSELKLGYTNVYNRELDIWEVVRTHENKEGYFYDDVGDLRYISKPSSYHIWDFTAKHWLEDANLKEKAKNELLDDYTWLQIKKDKMNELDLDIAELEKDIESIKNKLNEFK